MTTEAAGHRLSCVQCGFYREICDRHRQQWVGSGEDGRFGLPLYLTAQVGGYQLWAYNAAHIDALIDYLSATLRERPKGTSLRNKTMMSRIPFWMKSASARPRILRALRKLRNEAAQKGLS